MTMLNSYFCAFVVLLSNTFRKQSLMKLNKEEENRTEENLYTQRCTSHNVKLIFFVFSYFTIFIVIFF